MTRIVRLTSDSDLEAAKELFTEYVASLGVDLGFQDFEREVATLPGAYAPPRGVLLLAYDDDVAIGCVALRPLEWPRIAELKRLYVRPGGRGAGLGVRLSQAVLSFAREAGYGCVRLDTLPTMASAQRLYESLGFRDIEPYRFNPIAGTRYMELQLVADDDPPSSAGSAGAAL